ncbi:RcnB family protein [Parasphingorhabdus sp.]|uniref:RcnB family protein n=1 Tax=Parasphingorhabdus sp. TaxID=2709688 RepID=UPI002F93C4FF
MVLAASTMVVSPVITAQAQAAPYQSAQHKTVKKSVTNKNGKRVVTTKTTVRNNAPKYYNGNRNTTKRQNANRQNNNRYQQNRYQKSYYKANKKRWAKGQRFDRRYANNYRVINNPRAYRLSNAPRGHQWVQSGNDAVLIAITSGIIGAVIGNAIGR